MIKHIKDERQYEKILKRISALLQKDLKLDSKEYDELEKLSLLVKAYEDEHYPKLPPDLLSNTILLDQ